MHIAQRFGQLLDGSRRPDGSRWTGQQLDEATGGVVPRSYFTNLRKGRIESPGYEKMSAIAKAMGFPPEAWFDESLGDGAPSEPTDEDRGLAGRAEHLFDAIRNPKTGEPYTNEEAARMTLGDLSEEDILGIRTGAIAAPTVSQVVGWRAYSEWSPPTCWTGASRHSTESLWSPCVTRRSGRRPLRSCACPSGRGGWCWESFGSSGTRTSRRAGSLGGA